MRTDDRPSLRFWMCYALPRIGLVLAPGTIIFGLAYLLPLLPIEWRAPALFGLVCVLAAVAVCFITLGWYRQMRKYGDIDRDGNRIDRSGAA